MSLCPRHATVHADLSAALGNAHHGHRTARDGMTLRCACGYQLGHDGPCQEDE